VRTYHDDTRFAEQGIDLGIYECEVKVFMKIGKLGPAASE
jgi:hypothetical protein